MQKTDAFLTVVLYRAFQVLFLVTPLLFTWFNDELFEFNKMMFVYIITAIVGGTWVARAIIRGNIGWKRTPFDIPLALFVLSQLLSTLFSIHMKTSLFGYYGRFHGGLLSTLAYAVLFAVYVQSFSAKDFWKFLKALAVSSLLVALVAIPEHFGRSLSCVFINSHQLSETQPLSVVLSPRQLWHSYNVSCWIQDVQNRVFSTFGQPNWLAAFAVTLLPLFTLATIMRKGNERLLYGAASISLYLSVLFTKSRSGALGLGAGIAWFIITLGIWWYFWRGKKQISTMISHQGKRVLLSLSLIFVLCTAFFGTPYTPSIESYLKQASTAPTQLQTDPQASTNRLEEGGTDSGEIRKIVWAGALNVWKRFPLLGSGVETFAYSYYFERPLEHNTVSEWDHLYNKAHNELLNFMATTGIVGLAAYLFYLGVLIGAPIYFAVVRKDQDPSHIFSLLAISAGLVALTISNTLGFSTVMVGVLLALSGAWSWHLYLGEASAAAQALPRKDRRDELEPRQVLWLIVITLCVCVCVIFVWRTWRADHLFAKGKALNNLGQYALGIENLEHAYALNTSESVYVEELAEVYSWISAGFFEVNQATAAAAYREVSKQSVDQMMLENPYNLNFYKTKARVLAMLASQEPELLLEARETLEQAAKLAPTDPRVRYNLGLIELSLGATESAKANIMTAIEMRPTFVEAVQGLERIRQIEASAAATEI